jgi:hypothetical protein
MKRIVAFVLIPVLSLAAIGSAAAADDIYCFGARYKVGQPFIDSSKLRPGTLTDLGYEPIVRIEGVEQRRGAVSRTIAYVYYNDRGLTALAPAVESSTTDAEKDEFMVMLSRIGIKPPAPDLVPGTRFGNGFLRFFVGTQLDKSMDSTLELVKCQET